MRSVLVILLALGSYLPNFAQEDQLIERITSLMVENGNEQATIDTQETIHDLLQNPINLNAAKETELLECGLFNPYQVYGILKHREKYGDFFSIYEMTSIPGIQKSFLQEIQELISFSDQQKAVKQNKIKALLLSNIFNKFPEASAYYTDDSSAPIYPGSPIKISNRLKVNFGDKLIIAAAYEKDAGELAFDQWRPEHLSGYIAYTPKKILRTVILGNYKLHTGMGLVHGSGFNNSSSGVQLNGYRSSWSRPFASTAEYNYYRGILTELEWKNWNGMLFYSCKPEDISLFGIDDSTGNYNLFDMKRETGLHRTRTELQGKKLAIQQSGGFSFSRVQKHFNMGIAGAGSYLDLTPTLRDSVPFLDSAKRSQWNLSVNAISYGARYEAFAELAINDQLKPALITGAIIHLNPALSLNASFRYYHPDYTGQIPSAYTISSGVSNEIAFHTGALIIPFNNASILLDHDFCYFPSESFYLSIPGFSSRGKMELSYSFKDGSGLYFRYTLRQQQKDASNKGPGPETSSFTSKSQYRLHYSYGIGENLKLSGRMEWALSGKAEPGFLVYQQFQIKQQWLSLTYHVLLFDIDSWDNRIYAYEPGLRYSFSFPSYYGKGVKNSLTASTKLSRYVVLRVRLAHIHYANKWETGSGYEIRNGDQQFETEFQLQLSL